MTLSVLDMYSIGIGPSSSHTVGPMRAGNRFVKMLVESGSLDLVDRVHVDLFGSLGATGRGHASDKAVILGLEALKPESVDASEAEARYVAVQENGRINLGGQRSVHVNVAEDIVFVAGRSLPAHPNGMVFSAFDARGASLAEQTYYSTGGGFVADQEELVGVQTDSAIGSPQHPFSTGNELLRICEQQSASVSEILLANEAMWRPEEQTRASLLAIWHAMQDCVSAGLNRVGLLPGGLGVPRRAPNLHRRLRERSGDGDPLGALDWVGLYALSVNEENASGGRVVTAPTNGAAGVLPAVLHYVWNFVPGGRDEEKIVRFLLTSAAIGILVKQNASISGADVGCQGEVGTACAMAAAGLTEILGGTPRQVENAAEIAMEHHLGMTCDPIGALVQIPCIERNAIASVKAISAARLSLNGTGEHQVSLDQVIATMRETGRDMDVKYKETAGGGLAVNVVEC